MKLCAPVRVIAPPGEQVRRSFPEAGLLERSKCSDGFVREIEAAVRVPAALPSFAPGAMMAPAAVVTEPPSVPLPVRDALAAMETGVVPSVPVTSSEPWLMLVAPV